MQTLRDRQQKVATAELGERDVFGLKIGPSGAAIQVFAMRNGRVVERVTLGTDAAALARVPSLSSMARPDLPPSC